MRARRAARAFLPETTAPTTTIPASHSGHAWSPPPTIAQPPLAVVGYCALNASPAIGTDLGATMSPPSNVTPRVSVDPPRPAGSWATTSHTPAPTRRMGTEP